MFDKFSAMHYVGKGYHHDGEKLKHLVSKRLKKVLVSAYTHVPHYHQIMQKIGYHPTTDFSGPQDLKRFPFLKKKDLKHNPLEMFLFKGSDIKKLDKSSTTGSTGVPLIVYRNRFEKSVRISKFLRALTANGYNPLKKIMVVTVHARANQNKNFYTIIGLFRWAPVNCLLPVEEIVADISSYRPHVLIGNRSQLDIIALELIRQKKKPAGLEILVSCGEVIHANSRKLQKEGFGLPPIDNYAMEESGNLAFEISGHPGWFLNEDLTYFEFLDDDGRDVQAGETGNVVITDLTNKTMPFIRYFTGDKAVFENCTQKNGMNRKKLTKIIGREWEFIIFPDGTRHSSGILQKFMYRYPDVRQFVFLQKEIDKLEIMLVAENSVFDQVKNDLLKTLGDYFPSGFKFSIIQKKRIIPEKGDKLSIFYQKLS